MIILDAHAWVWGISESPELYNKTKVAIQQSDNVGISAISCWEVAMLADKERIGFSIDAQKWIELAFKSSQDKLLPITPGIAVRSTRLSANFHGEPANRLIVATSLVHESPLASKAGRLQIQNL